MPIGLKTMYGLEWPESADPLEIELFFIRNGGKHVDGGVEHGEGLFHHMRQAITMLWPEDDHHRWSDLFLRRKSENDIVVQLGAADSGKTFCSARYILCDWWSAPDRTLWIVSSTELRGAELRIWGKMKELFNRARERYPWLPGNVLEGRTCITPDQISEENSEGRLLTRGIIFVPCRKGGEWVGLGPLVGIKPAKNGRLGHCGDELSFMNESLLSAYANWYGKESFQGILQGNITAVDDPLGVSAEPANGGWEAWQDNGRTQEWRSKFYDAWVIAFDGRDSPNLDYPEDQPTRFPYLVGHKKLKAVAASEGEDSPVFWNQCVGKPQPGAEKLKVITRQLCEQGGVFEPVVWRGTQVTDVVSLDAAYGGVGGDRCVLIHIKFGEEQTGRIVIACLPPRLVPVSVRNPEIPEDQIARWCKNYCESVNVQPSHFFFDGRSTLAIAMARIWSPQVNVVDFGGPATKRPVSLDEFVWEGDENTKRLKRCDEHYSKFVTELWFAVRYCALAKQLRDLPREVAQEGCKRVWRYTKGTPNRMEVETKAEMKERTGISPDYFDALVTAVEGARRLGFQIQNLKEESALSDEDYFDTEARKWQEVIQSRLLRHA